MYEILNIFSMSFLCPSLLDFVANLVQLDTKLGSEINEKSLQEGSKSEANMHLISDTFFH